MEESKSDLSAEKAIISGLFKYGKDGLAEVNDIINKDSFCDPFYKICYIALEDLISSESDIKPDVSVLIHKLQEKRLVTQISIEEGKLIRAISVMPIEMTNVRKMAKSVAKLSIARKIRDNLLNAAETINGMDQEESLGNILGVAESAVFDNDYSVDSDSSTDKLASIGEGLDAYVNALLDNPVDQIGFPVGLPEWEKAIGGGPRPGTVHVIGSRIKTGKTFMADHICTCASAKGIPVLNLDTEMMKQDHWDRLLGKVTGLKLEDIEKGRVDPKKIKEGVSYLNSLKYHYQNIGGKQTEEILSIIRRWLIKEVGLTPEGKAKGPCIVVYDYIKLMDSASITKNIAEYQAIGFLMTQLHNFMTKYGVACVAFVQLNREGVTQEDSTTAAQSDRIVWLCSSFSIFKWKDREDLIVEMNKPEETRYTHKLINLLCRHGKGTAPGDFIHIKTDYSRGKLEEGPLDSRINSQGDSGSDASDEQIEF